MNTKHTPGPWFNVENTDIRADYPNQNGKHIATVWANGETQTAANAHLIAAPEMLVLLRDCESYTGAMAAFHNSGEGAQLAARCRAMISKAEGKESAIIEKHLPSNSTTAEMCRKCSGTGWVESGEVIPDRCEWCDGEGVIETNDEHGGSQS